MEIRIKNIKKNEMVGNTVVKVNSLEEMENHVENLATIIALKKLDLMGKGVPYEEVKEDGFTGFISDSFQYIKYGNYFEYTEGDETIQMTFILESVSQAA